MLYMIGGAPRTGKTILAQRIAAKLNIGWVSTDTLSAIVRLKDENGAKTNLISRPDLQRITLRGSSHIWSALSGV